MYYLRMTFAHGVVNADAYIRGSTVGSLADKQVSFAEMQDFLAELLRCKRALYCQKEPYTSILTAYTTSCTNESYLLQTLILPSLRSTRHPYEHSTVSLTHMFIYDVRVNL